MSTYTGSCHCGRVTFEFTNAVVSALECNCSICSRKGALWHATDNDHFRILTGQDDLAVYQFGTRTASHYFCRHCGISTFSHPRIAPQGWVVNLRCVSGLYLATLPQRRFDGKNWEQAAQALTDTRNKALARRGLQS
ncbi:MAG: GFA family protein [Betaproteobacteria bacterium]|jgi:hypothetical protein|nr:GFA family protein [Betaproteobacteria bacterium]